MGRLVWLEDWCGWKIGVVGRLLVSLITTPLVVNPLLFVRDNKFITDLLGW